MNEQEFGNDMGIAFLYNGKRNAESYLDKTKSGLEYDTPAS